MSVTINGLICVMSVHVHTSKIFKWAIGLQTSEMLSIVGERERTHQSVMWVWSKMLCAHAIRMCMLLSGVDMLREEIYSTSHRKVSVFFPFPFRSVAVFFFRFFSVPVFFLSRFP